MWKHMNYTRIYNCDYNKIHVKPCSLNLWILVINNNNYNVRENVTTLHFRSILDKAVYYAENSNYALQDKRSGKSVKLRQATRPGAVCWLPGPCNMGIVAPVIPLPRYGTLSSYEIRL